MIDTRKRLEYLRENKGNPSLFRAGVVGLNQNDYESLIELIVAQREQAERLVRELGRLQIAVRSEYNNRES